MSRNTEKNIKKHNDKLHKAQAKVKSASVARKEMLKKIVRKFNTDSDSNLLVVLLSDTKISKNIT